MADTATSSIDLACRCGDVHGRVVRASPEAADHMLCYCDDCQAYLHHLGRTDLFDGHGGTDIVQVAPSALSFDRGVDRIVGLRLTPKGLYRWYASCCKTPLGNSFGSALPFVGLVVQTFDGGKERADAVFGPTLAAARGNFAVNGLRAATTEIGPRLLLRAIRYARLEVARPDLAAPLLRRGDRQAGPPDSGALQRRTRSAAAPMRSAAFGNGSRLTTSRDAPRQALDGAKSFPA